MRHTKKIALFLLLFIPFLLRAQTAGFLENKGQVQDQHGNFRPDVAFLLPMPGMNLVLRDGGFSYDTYRWEAAELPDAPRELPAAHPTREVHRVDIALQGANPQARWEAEQPLPEQFHFYTTTAKGVPAVQAFRKVTCRNIYPHIDLEFVVGAAAEKPVEYNFILHPGARLADIALAYLGAEMAELAGQNIELRVAHGKVVEEIPASYWSDGQRKVEMKYEVRAQEKGEFVVGFAGEADEFSVPIKEKLVIDPAPLLTWATYYGGTGEDEIRGMATDAQGHVIVAGITESGNMIATTGAYQTSLSGMPNAFVAKMDSNGVRQWASYYGGALTEAYGIAVGPQGKIVLTGTTTATTGMTTPGAWQTLFSGQRDAFLARFSANGMREWATYFGAPAEDEGTDVAVDGQGNVFVCGNTESFSGLSTNGAHQAVRDSFVDCFLAKFDSTGMLDWSTYYGGPGDDFAEAIALAPNGDVLFGGGTSSPIRIATSGAHQVAYNGNEDGFLVRFSTSGARIFGSYFGDGGTENIQGLATDGAGNVLVTGFTSSVTGIATPGSWQPNISPPGTGDAFLAKFSPTGQRVWGTYFGQPDFDGGFAMAADAAGNSYLGGFSTSASGLASSGAFQVGNAGGQDGFVAHFDAAGQRIWSTYLGGANSDEITGIGQSAAGHLFVVGNTTSASGLATVGAHQTVLNGLGEGFLVRIGICQIPDSVQVSLGPAQFCAGANVTLQVAGNLGDATQWQWYADSCGGMSAGTGASISVVAGLPRTYYVRGEGGCTLDLLCDSVVVAPVVVDTSLVLAAGTLMSNAAPATYQWLDCGTGQPVPGATAQSFSPAAPGNYALVVTENGCTDTSACYAVTAVGLVVPSFAGQIYPNPGPGKFILEASVPAGPLSILVYDMLGQLVAEREATGPELRAVFDLAGHGAGVYRIVLRTAAGTRVFAYLLR